MPGIDVELRGFAPPRPSGLVTVSVSRLRLLAAAVTLGAPSIGSSAWWSRPFVELIWRAAIVDANLEESADRRSWTRSEAYDRLDPSEKTAVSYFLGMTQATLTVSALGYTHFVHLDTLLRASNLSLGKTRPDLLAMRSLGPGRGFEFATLEAKGRTNGFDQAALVRAKTQAQTVRTIRGNTPRETIGSVAYFDDEVRWSSVLHDPDWVGTEMPIGTEAYLREFYGTVIEAAKEAPSSQVNDSTLRFGLGGSGIEVLVPMGLVEAYDQSRRESEAAPIGPLARAVEILALRQADPEGFGFITVRLSN